MSSHFTYITAHSPNLPSLYLSHPFSNPSVALLTSQLIFQPFRCFTYVTIHSPTLLSLLLRHRLFTYVTSRAVHDREREKKREIARHNFIERAHSPTFPSLHLHHRSFSNPFVPLPTSQPFRCFTYVTVHSPTLLSLFLRHRLFTYVTWRAAHGS